MTWVLSNTQLLVIIANEGCIARAESKKKVTYLAIHIRTANTNATIMESLIRVEDTMRYALRK